jgi:hypothetical protein
MNVYRGSEFLVSLLSVKSGNTSPANTRIELRPACLFRLLGASKTGLSFAPFFSVHRFSISTKGNEMQVRRLVILMSLLVVTAVVAINEVESSAYGDSLTSNQIQ